MAFDQDLTCLIFPIKIGRNAQWVHLFSMDFDDFLTIHLIFDGKSIFQWEHHIPSIKGCDAIRPALNCFISMIISVDTLCGFAPSVQTCLIFPLQWVSFLIKISRSAQTEHLFSMYFD